MKYENTNRLRGVLMLLALIVLFAASFSIPEAHAAGPWQDARLYKLSNYQLDREKRELVTIYSGFTDTQVERVLDNQFDHVQYMMFVNTVITSPDGKPKRDKATGEVQTEDDGC